MAEIIGVKQMYKSLKQIAKRAKGGESFIVVKHAKPLFLLTPYKERGEAKRYTLKDFERLWRKTSSRNLSKQIDQIAYGI